MQSTGGGASPRGLDARLLRFRSRPGTEEPAKLAEDLLTAGRGAESVEVVESALQIAPNDARLLLVQGRALLNEGELERAQAALVSAARIDARNKDAFRYLGEVLLKRGDPARAAKVLERAGLLDPEDRAIKVLVERASRLARLADDDPAAAAVAARQSMSPAPPRADANDAATVVRPEPVDRGAPPARRPQAPQAAAPAPAPAPAPRALAGRELVDTGDILLDDDEDAPTTVGFLPATEAVAAPSPRARADSRSVGAPSPFDAPAAPAPAPPPVFQPEPPTRPALRVPAIKPPVSTIAGQGPSLFGGTDPFAPTERREAVQAVMPTEPSRPAAPGSYPPPPYEPSTSVEVEPAEFDSAEPEPDPPAGELAGAEEDVEGILRMLAREGIFEQPTGEPAVWAPKKEIQRAGSRIGRLLAVAWVVAVLLAAGGYFGWTRWVQSRHEESARLTVEARREAQDGDHAKLVDAERHLVGARELDARGTEGPKILLFVHAQRALEDGAFEAGYLRPTIERARKAGADRNYVAAARAVLMAADGDAPGARRQLAAAVRGAPNDANILYLAGRLEQRLGDEGALAHLDAAVHKDPMLTAPAIALAEAKADDGDHEAAMQLVQGILRRRPNHLRARLWNVYLQADDLDPVRGLADVTRLAQGLDRGAPTDRVLVELTRARLQRRKGDARTAAASVERAIRAGASEPRLLALVAAEARGLGRLQRAQEAATAAVRGAPTNPDFKKLLAGILIDRRDGFRALETLRGLSTDDPDVLLMSARAALLVGTDQSLQAALEGLDAYITQNPDASIEVKALRIRARVQTGQAVEALAEARALASAAPGDPVASLALGEAALANHDAAAAMTALGQAARAAPDDPEGHFLLGRARRMAGDADGAEGAFRRALELSPEHGDAKTALGRLLLDRGKYAEADQIFQELSRGFASGLVGRLGRVEALLGLGRVDDAQVQMQGVRPQDRENASARVTAAHVALARNRPGEAVAQLRPLAEGDRKTADVLALFGDALFAAGEVDAAAGQYDAALVIDNGLPEALVGRAAAAVRAERSSDALGYLSRAEQSLSERIRPPEFRARYLTVLGRARLGAGRSEADSARDALRRATEIPGAPPEAFFFLGESLAGMNSPDARAAYQRYVELAPEGEYAGRARRAVGGR